MGKPARSPVLGYNHNVRYHGRIYHVQTEDSGPVNPRIFTHLFHAGTILASKRFDYDPGVSEGDVRGLMQDLHKAILKELKRGVYDDKIVAFFVAIGQEPFLDQVGDSADESAAPPLEQDAGAEGLAAPPPSLAHVGDETLRMDAPQFAAVDPGPPALELELEPTATPPPWSPPEPALAPPVVELPAPPPAMPAAASAHTTIMLDLDALPPVEETPPPLPTTRPPSVPPPPPRSYQPPERPDGVGIYVRRGGGTERPFSPEPTRPTSPRPSHGPATRPPVVVIRPPQQQRVRPQTPTSKPPAGGVVVQRTVVVGVGGPGGAGNRPRPPRPSVPYVVKEGSHPIVQNPRAAQVAPPVSPVPPPPGYRAPTPPPAATISDKSLDEVILAYLSQDGDKR